MSTDKIDESEIQSKISLDENLNCVSFEEIEKILVTMSTEANLLKSGFNIFSSFETKNNFYLNFLKIILCSENSDKVKKLAASTLKIFLTKNWSDDNYIKNEERLVNIC